MEVITIESKAFKELMEKVNTIAKFVLNYQPEEINDEETWVDGYEVCTFLKISERTLQRLRSKGEISYSIISGKTYYTIAEVKRMLNERLVRSNQESLNNLIENHKTYVEQRRNTRSDK
ncbi:MAG: helix-turn-helix domain-containing protein [Bacteroidota bacterium]|nr:helix-turn-helix domain-containing protein [Bacteroidota bacterium]